MNENEKNWRKKKKVSELCNFCIDCCCRMTTKATKTTQHCGSWWMKLLANENRKTDLFHSNWHRTIHRINSSDSIRTRRGAPSQSYIYRPSFVRYGKFWSQFKIRNSNLNESLNRRYYYEMQLFALWKSVWFFSLFFFVLLCSYDRQEVRLKVTIVSNEVGCSAAIVSIDTRTASAPYWQNSEPYISYWLLIRYTSSWLKKKCEKQRKYFPIRICYVKRSISNDKSSSFYDVNALNVICHHSIVEDLKFCEYGQRNVMRETEKLSRTSRDDNGTIHTCVHNCQNVTDENRII